MYDLALSGVQFKMRHRVISKLKEVGATSREKAVAIEDASLDIQEQRWLRYFAGAFLGRIKKTRDKRYYI